MPQMIKNLGKKKNLFLAKMERCNNQECKKYPGEFLSGILPFI